MSNALLRQQNNMLKEMNSYMKKLSETMGNFGKKQKEVTEQSKKATETEKGLNKEYKTRTEILTQALKKLGENGKEAKKFEITSKKARDAYKAEGGNVFDFIDLALTSANQRVKIFGIEAALARKVMYGFLPPGMFRLVNKLSTSFRFLGGIFRQTGEDGENIDNIFKKMARGLLSLPKLMKMKKGDFNIMGKIKAGFGEAKRIGNVSKGFGVAIGQEKKTIRDAGRQMAQGKISEDEFTKIREAAEKQIELLEEAKDKSIETSKMGKFTNKFIKGLKATPKFLGQALMFFGKIMIYTTIFLTIAYLLYKTVGKTLIEAVKEAMPAIKAMGALVIGSLMMVWEGVSSIFNAFFGDGNLTDVIDGVIQIAVGLLGFALSAAGVILVALGGFVVEFIGLAVSKTIAFLTGAFTSWNGFFKALPLILGIVAGVIAFIYSAPIWVVALAFIVLYRFGAWIVKKIANVVPGLATGGVVNTGMQIVGEKGPELVSLPRGSRVHSNSQSKRMVGNSGVVNNYNITINAKDTSKAEMRRVADEIGRMVSSKINRRTSHRSSV